MKNIIALLILSCFLVAQDHKTNVNKSNWHYEDGEEYSFEMKNGKIGTIKLEIFQKHHTSPKYESLNKYHVGDFKNQSHLRGKSNTFIACQCQNLVIIHDSVEGFNPHWVDITIQNDPLWGSQMDHFEDPCGFSYALCDSPVSLGITNDPLYIYKHPK